MSRWPASKARRVLAALLKIGWQIRRQSGSHRTLSRAGRDDFVFAFHDDEEIGPKMVAFEVPCGGHVPPCLANEPR
jgi:predicted RNA binding protein YcfA (HicA-like mRNA interferase family)